MKKTQEQISYNMRRVKNKDSDIECLLRKELWARGIRYRKNVTKVMGKPDIAFVTKKIAVFCDSEFWHGYNWEERKNVMSFSPYYVPGTKTDEQKSQEDLYNVRLLYEAYKSLTPLQASNKYLWTYLCHANPEYRKYIIDHWLTDARENTIRTRFFVKTSRDLLNDNALARLWWYGYLTYDESNANPYALTEILLTNQTICTDVIDTLNRMNFQRIKGLLLAIKDFKNLVGEKEGITDYVRSCNKYLNRYAAVTIMELLDSDEIQKLAFEYMKKQRDIKKQK